MKTQMILCLLAGLTLRLAAAAEPAARAGTPAPIAPDMRHDLVERWRTPPVFDVPESVLYCPRERILFVSNVAGAPLEKNGRGFISKVLPGGKTDVLKWATGLNAPKGMAISGGFLYATDIDRLVQMDLKTGAVTASYAAPGAVFLNDAAADAEGRIYVSDSSSENSVIYRLADGKLEPWLSAPEIRAPNGLFMQGDRLLVGDGKPGALHAVDLNTRRIVRLAPSELPIDGLQPVNGGWLVSDWKGTVSLIAADGRSLVLLDTSDQNINAADFEYIRDERLLIIPTFFDNRLIAYEVFPSGGGL